MAFHFQHLGDARVRSLMAAEVAADVAADKFYKCPRLNTRGQVAWPMLLAEAVASHNDVWLATQLDGGDLFNNFEERKGRYVKVPYTAAATLAEGEFNRYYIRALCRLAIDNHLGDVEVCRGKAVTTPRWESEAKIGQRVPAGKLLADVRASQGLETVLGVPAGPNSGLTVRLPPADTRPMGESSPGLS